MLSRKHTVNQAPGRDTAPAGTGLGSEPFIANRLAVESRARRERAEIIGGWIGSGVARFVAALQAAHRRRVAMAELSALDSRMLADIGLSRSDIRAAVNGASGFLPRTLAMPTAAPSLNDDTVHRAA